MSLDKILLGTVGEDIRSQNPSHLSDQENMDQTDDVTQGKKKLPDEQPSFERARKAGKEFCEPTKKAKRRSSGQSASTNKSKIAKVVDKLPDVLLQLLRPDRKADGPLIDSDPCKSETRCQLPDSSSSTGFVVKTFTSLFLESLFYTLYREDEEQDVRLGIAHSQKMESDMGHVSMERRQETNAEWTEQKTNMSTERAATHPAEPQHSLQTLQRQRVGGSIKVHPKRRNSAHHSSPDRQERGGTEVLVLPHKDVL